MDFPNVSPAEEEATPLGGDPAEEGGNTEGRRHISAIQRRRLKKLGVSGGAGLEVLEEPGPGLAAAGVAEPDFTGSADNLQPTVRGT